MRRMVVGLMFTDDMEEVVLLHKEHGPRCVVGRWNGVGGKVEDDETPRQAMRREFEEETGVDTVPTKWHHFVTLISNDSVPEEDRAKVYFYYARDSSAALAIDTTTDEEVNLFESCELPATIMNNLRWMIPFCMDSSITTEKFLGTIEFSNSAHE